MTEQWFGRRCHAYAPRIALEAESRDAAALAFSVKLFGKDAQTPHHIGRGRYAPRYLNFMGEVSDAGAPFRIYKPLDQSRRGVDEGSAAHACAALMIGPGWTVQEFSLYHVGIGEGRADLALIPDQGDMTGIEIKTDRDSLARLPRQVALYDAAFPYRILATTQRHLAAALAVLPEAWGVELLDAETHVWVETVRQGQRGRGRTPHPGLNELWQSELVQLATPLRLKGLKRKTCTQLCTALVAAHGAAVQGLALAQLGQRSVKARVKCIRRGAP